MKEEINIKYEMVIVLLLLTEVLVEDGRRY